MTQAPETRKFVKTNQRSKSSKVWIALSFTLSALILGWAFSLPFRQHRHFACLVSERRGTKRSIPSNRSRSRNDVRMRKSFGKRQSPWTKKFMQSIRKKRDAENRPRPGINESREHWQRHVKSVKKELQTLRNAKEGTIEWDYRQTPAKVA